jgi:hypothetical protein
MGYKEILRLYLIAQTSRAMPGEKRYNWDTYKVKHGLKYWTYQQNIDRCGVADSGKCNQPITELIYFLDKNQCTVSHTEQDIGHGPWNQQKYSEC